MNKYIWQSQILVFIQQPFKNTIFVIKLTITKFEIMKMKTISFILLTAIALSSCSNRKVKQVVLTKPISTHLGELSSASGIAILNNSIYIVGDDVPWLYKLDDKNKIISKTQISATDSIIQGRTPKSLKADFEGAEIIINGDNPEIVIISSGSILHNRDTAYIIDISDDNIYFSKNLRPLYEKIKLISNLPIDNEINIEGIAFSDNYAYLAHRGNVSENILIEINRDKFLDFIKGVTNIPDFKIYRFNLPMINGISSGFSGLCLTPDKTGLIFTASVEDTDDEINDGKILGSFVGIIPFSGIKDKELESSILMNGKIPLEKKLEGISVKSLMEKGGLQMIAVCDNDNGTSDIISFNMYFK